MKSLFITLLLALTSLICRAQYIFSEVTSPYITCANATYRVNVYTDGVPLPATFTVELSNDNFDVNIVTVATFPSNGTYSQFFDCVIPAGTLEGNNYKFRTKSPGVSNISNSSAFSIISGTPTISMTGIYSIFTCGGYANIPVTVTGNGAITYQYQINSNAPISNTVYATGSPTIYTQVPGTYTILSVSNACGAGTILANHVATVNVIAPTLSIDAVSDDNVCAGNKISVDYTTSQSAFIHTIQMSDNTGTNFTDLPTTIKSSTTLYAAISGPNAMAGTGYKLRVVLNNAGVVCASAPSAATITVRPTPAIQSIEYLNAYGYGANSGGNRNFTIAKKENVQLKFTFVGTPPFSVAYNNTSFSAAASPYILELSPTATQSYYFGSVIDAGGCARGMPLASRYNITIKDVVTEIKIKDKRNLDNSTKWRNYCPMETIKVDYRIRGNYSLSDMKAQYSSASVIEWTDLPALVDYNNDIFEVQLPDLTAGKYKLRLVPQNASLSFESVGINYINDFDGHGDDFRIISKVKGGFTDISPIKIKSGEAVNLHFEFKGGPEQIIKESLLFSNANIYRPILTSNFGSTIPNYQFTQGYGNNFPQMQIDTLTRSATFTLSSFEAGSNASGTLSCPSVEDSSYSPIILPNNNVQIIIINDPSRSITTGTISLPATICGGQTITVPYTSTGVFNAANTFKVQIRELTLPYASPNLTQYTDLPTISSTLNNIMVALPYKSKLAYYQIRVVSSNPEILGTPSPTIINVYNQAPYVYLAGSAYVVPGELAGLKAKVGEAAPYFNFNIQNGGFTQTFNSVFYTNYAEALVPTPITALPNTSLIYTASNASNTCGNGIYSAGATVNFVASPIITLGTPNPTPKCGNGSVLSLPFTASRTFDSENVFKIKVWHLDYGAPTYYNAILSGSKSPFTITLPSDFLSTTYYFQVFSSSPYTTSNVLSFVMKRSPIGMQGLSNATIDMGDFHTFNLSNSVNNTAPYSFDFTSGDRSTSISTSTNPYAITVNPSFTTVYSILNFQDANCKEAPINLTTATVSVVEKKQYLELLSLNVSKLCNGGTINAVFLKSGTSSAYNLQLSDANGNNFVDLPTTLSGNILTGTLPASIANGNNYRIRIKATGGIFSLNYPLPLSSGSNIAPTAVISGGGNIVKDQNSFYFTGQTAFIKVDFTGTAPYTFNLNDGTTNKTIITETNPYYLPVNPLITTTYTINTLSNPCLSGTSSGTAVVNVLEITSAEFNASTKFCLGNTVSTSFAKIGTYAPDNQFELEFVLDNTYSTTTPANAHFIIPATVSGNIITGIIPATLAYSSKFDRKFYYARVNSTNPKIYGEYQSISNQVFKGNPILNITGSTTIAAGVSTPLSIEASHFTESTTFTLNNGTSSQVYNLDNSSIINVSPAVTTNYTITGVSSYCNDGTVGSPNLAIITVSNCPTNQSITLNINAGVTQKYESNGTINAINIINSGARIIYDGQNGVLLNPGFKVENGAVFQAYIDGCGGLK